MRAIAYAYLGPEEAAARLAKRSAPSDVALFDAKKGDATLNLIVPIRYPDKLSSLLATLDLCDEVILHPAALDRTFGEQVVGAELFGRTRGFVRLPPNLGPDQVRPLLARTALKDLEVNEEPEGVFREKLYDRVASGTEGSLVLPIDHAFPVKGVGTVALGRVRSGEVATHQQLQAYPTSRVVDVRSIQVHDVDVPRAPTRSRVGLALKGIEAQELPRGTVFAPPGTVRVVLQGQAFPVHVQASPFSKWVPKDGAVLHAYHCLQDVVVRVEGVMEASAAGFRATLRPEADLAFVPAQPLVLVDLDQKAQRFVGRVRPP